MSGFAEAFLRILLAALPKVLPEAALQPDPVVCLRRLLLPVCRFELVLDGATLILPFLLPNFAVDFSLDFAGYELLSSSFDSSCAASV